MAIAVLVLCSRLSAQVYPPVMPNYFGPIQWVTFPDYNQIREARVHQQKWFLSRYSALSAGHTFYPGGTAFTVSAPIGLQLNRQLNNNLYAFGGVYAAPTFTSFSHSFMNTPYNSSYPGSFYNANYFGINPGVQMGLMYINDAGTFSISGSVRVERSSYPVYTPPADNRRK